MGYETPTPIQQQAIGPVLEGRDAMGLAQTGTGKTAAFMLPLLQRFMDKPTQGRKKTRALIIAPTRELAEQINDNARDLGRGTGVRATTVYGGVNANPQIRALRAGTEIIVACPGRLLDLMNQGFADVSGVEAVVLDEADQMFDMGFLPDIKRILAALPRTRQTLLFSATMPKEIRRLCGDILSDPVTVSIGRTAPAETVSHALYPTPPHLKKDLLVELLRRTETDSVLVFTRTKHRAKRLAQQLERKGFPTTSLQGNLSQNKRQAAMRGFRSGKYKVLVATDIAARGIDINQVSHVINFDIPNTPEAYTHRIGRTGRAAKTGDAFTLVTREDRSMIRSIERVLGRAIETRTLEDFDYDAPAPRRGDAPAGQPGRPQRNNDGRTTAGRGRSRSRSRGNGRGASGKRSGFAPSGAGSSGERRGAAHFSG